MIPLRAAKQQLKSLPSQSTKPATRIGATWTSSWVFLLAAMSTSIGLGNIWKFPYELGLHGGGTFLLVYLPCVLIVGLPVMMAEFMIGRYGASNPVHGILRIARRERLSSLWQSIGWLSILTGFIVFSFYSVVASWILFYIMQSATGSFQDVPAEIVQRSFSALLGNTDQLLIWYTVFVLLVVLILTRGIRQGLERALLLLMPCFVIMLIWLCIYAAQVGNFEYAKAFMLSVDVSAIDAELIVTALTQALFSLSIGIGALIMYGAYLGEGRPLAGSAFVVMLFDTIVAIAMGLLIFSIVFAFELRPDTGTGLIFETLPVAFSQMSENSNLWSTVFFGLLGVAALTSAFALLEPMIAWLVRKFEFSRRVAAWLVGGLAWLAGLPALLSFGGNGYRFYYFGKEYQNGTFDLLNILATHLLMPLTAFLIAIFAAWRISRRQSQAVLSIPVEMGYRLWRWITKSVAPLSLIVVILIVLLYPGG